MKQIKRELLLLTLPIALQNLVGFLANLVDTIMIGQWSENGFAAVSLANQIFFIITLVISGISGGSNVILSQMWGRKDKEGMYKVMAYTYRVVLLFVCVVSLVVILFPTSVMSILTNENELIELGSQYLKIIGISYLFYGVSATTLQVLRSANVVKISMISSFIALSLNVFLNYILIFGNFGFPALGIQGAAIATTLARIIELIAVLIYVYFIDHQVEIRVSKLLKTDSKYLSIFISKCSPVALNELMWSLGESAVVMIIGRMGTSMVSTIAVYNVIAQLSNILMNGVDSAACVMIGNTLGKKDKELLNIQVSLFKKLSLIVGLIDGCMMVCCIPLVPYVYELSYETLNMLAPILMCGGIIEVFKSMQCMNMMGILRGGGDVKFACLNDIVFLWFVVIPLGYLGAFVFKWSYLIVFICIKCDQILKYFTSEWRTRQPESMKYIEV